MSLLSRSSVLLAAAAMAVSAQQPPARANPPQGQPPRRDSAAAPGDSARPGGGGAGPLGSLRSRSIGPALTSGRVGDIAVHPKDNRTWFVAVASGGVWKTTNAGNTWTPVFDNEGT